MIFVISLRQRFLGNKILIVEWDMNIVTATDYSVELEIDRDGYQRWLETEYRKSGGDRDNGVSSGLALKNYIIKHVEEKLTEEWQTFRNNI